MLSAGLLVLLAREDRWRSDPMPNLSEGWLDILVPLAWAALAALAVQEEPLVGDNHFWMTRPYQRPALLAAKALFVLLFIHVPAFLTDTWVIMMHGFSPISYLPQLASKQAWLAAGLTLPAMALAASVRNFMQFLFAATVFPGAVILFTSAIRSPAFRFQEPPVRSELTLAILGVAALVVVVSQYLGPSRFWSRAVGIMGAVIAACCSV